MVIPQAIDYLPRDIFVATQLTGGQDLHLPTRDLSEAPEGNLVFPMIGVETSTQEEGLMCSLVVA